MLESIWPHFRNGRIALGAVIVMTAAIVYAAWSLGMSQRVDTRYTVHAFPTVISAMFHGRPWDYSAYEGVVRVLMAGQRAGKADTSLIDAAQLQLSGQDRTLRYFPYDDKGYADLTWIGFTLFGVSIASVFWAYMLLLTASIAVYLIAFWRDVTALVLLNVILAAIYVAIFAFPVSTALGEITNPRANLLSIVAIAHLLYVALRGGSLGWLGIAAVLLQSALMAFTVFCRSPEIGQAALVIVTAAGAVLWRLKTKMSAGAPLIVAGAMIAALACLPVYQRAYFNPVYFDTYGKARLMWHNAGIGFALNPDLAKAYTLAISDEAMFRLVAARAKADGTYDLIFTDRDRLTKNPVGDFLRYEAYGRDIVLDIVRTHPLQALLTFIVYKPLALINTFREAISDNAGLTRPDFEVKYISAAERQRLDAYYNPFRLLPLVLQAICAASVAMAGQMRQWRVPAAIVILIFAGSAIAPMASYPLYHILGTFFATATALIYIVALYAAAFLGSYIYARQHDR